MIFVFRCTERVSIQTGQQIRRIQQLKDRITNSFQHLQNKPELHERIRNNIKCELQMYLQSNGGHIETATQDSVTTKHRSRRIDSLASNSTYKINIFQSLKSKIHETLHSIFYLQKDIQGYDKWFLGQVWSLRRLEHDNIEKNFDPEKVGQGNFF